MTIFNQESAHPLIQIRNESDWNLVYSACNGYLTRKDHKKLRDYLKDDVKTVILEKDYIDKDYRDTFYNFYSKKFAQYPSSTIRLHFFKVIIPENKIFNLDIYNTHYLGFSVIRPSRINSIGRTVINPKAHSKISGHMCKTEYKVHVLGSELKVEGFPYISQDTDVTRCAHAACWMVFRYFSERYSRYREVLPYEISQLTEDYSYGRLVPSKGLTVFQITEIFSRFGFYPVIYFRKALPDPNQFESLLYYYVESGLPVVAGSEKLEHAITVFGHVLDYHKPTVKGDSSDFITGFIVNDDNHLPYQRLMKKSESKMGYSSRHSLEDIDCFVVPLYEKIYLTAEYVDKLSQAILNHPQLGVKALSKLIKPKKILRRIYLTSSKSYKLQRRKSDIPSNLNLIYSEMAMPKFIWVCEISERDYYVQNKIIGEIIFDATASQLDRFAFLSIHYPDFLLLNDRNILEDVPERFKQYPLQMDKVKPYDLYVNNLKEV